MGGGGAISTRIQKKTAPSFQIILKTFTEHLNVTHFVRYHKCFCRVNVCRDTATFVVSKDHNCEITFLEITFLQKWPSSKLSWFSIEKMNKTNLTFFKSFLFLRVVLPHVHKELNIWRNFQLDIYFRVQSQYKISAFHIVSLLLF